MPTAILKPVDYATEPPFGSGGVNDFFVYDTGIGSWHLVGTADAGVALQEDADGKTLDAVNGGAGSGVASSGVVLFADAGDIPPGSTIVSVQLRVKGTFDGINLATVFAPFTIAWDTVTAVPLTGADTDNFTGAGVFSSAAMTVRPGSASAWVFDDLYGASLPFTDPKGFQGWWSFNASTGTVSDPDTSAYSLDSIQLIVEWEAGAQTPTNWNFGAVMGHTREFGIMRVS